MKASRKPTTKRPALLRCLKKLERGILSLPGSWTDEATLFGRIMGCKLLETCDNVLYPPYNEGDPKCFGGIPVLTVSGAVSRAMRRLGLSEINSIDSHGDDIQGKILGIGAKNTTKVLQQNPQKEMSQLRSLVDSSPTARKRWVWELIQNAKDVNINGKVQIRIEADLEGDDSHVMFKHNGRPFSTENIRFLIEQVSSRSVKMLLEGQPQLASLGPASLRRICFPKSLQFRVSSKKMTSPQQLNCSWIADLRQKDYSRC